jgi:DNA-binding transcriptional regulator GbsR (MarR family)
MKAEILGAAKKEIINRRDKQKKEVDKRTVKLRKAFDDRESMKRRSNLRIKLDNASERLAKYERQLHIIENWSKAVMQKEYERVQKL